MTLAMLDHVHLSGVERSYSTVMSQTSLDKNEVPGAQGSISDSHL